MTTALSRLDSDPPFSWKNGLIGLALAIVTAIVTTSIAYVIVDAAGLIPDSVTIEKPTGGRGAIGIGEVIGAVTSSWLIASIILLLLRRFTARPLMWFVIVAAVVLIVSFAEPPALIEDVPARMVVGLNLLHVVAAVSGVGALLVFLRSRG